MTAGKGITGGSRDGGGNRLESRIQDPGSWYPEGNLQILDQEPGGEEGKRRLVGECFVKSPIKVTDDCQDGDILSKIGTQLEEGIAQWSAKPR